MAGECYFYRGIVLPSENGHFRLGEHSAHSHDVYLHERCATGHDLVDRDDAPTVCVEIQYPECDEIETQ